jgi:hypothetical protein
MRKFTFCFLILSLIGPGSSALAFATADIGVVAKGFGVSPGGFPLDYGQLPAFYNEVAGMAGGAVLWNGAWRDDLTGGTDAGLIPAGARVNLQNAAIYRFTPAVVFGWRSGARLLINVPANATNNWTNAEAQSLFGKMVASCVATYDPPFVFLGNENDFYYESSPGDYANWIAVYNRTYDLIKAASPATQVGPVFSYEHIAGSGRLNGWTTSYWPALEMHDLTRVDIIGITLYPWLNFATAASVPEGYLDALWSRIGLKPVAITETGWPAENLGGLFPPWETTESAPVTYLTRLAVVLQGRPVRMVNYLFLHAMQDPGGSPLEWKLFGSVSIRDAHGNPRMVYSSWLAFLLRFRRRAAGH